jgi:hypothetical protein
MVLLVHLVQGEDGSSGITPNVDFDRSFNITTTR